MFRFSVTGGVGQAPSERQLRDENSRRIFVSELTASPTLYPLALDGPAKAVQFIALDEAGYAAASFLDSRIEPVAVRCGWRSWDDVRQAAAALTENCHFIFHISHVGSTLLSRLVGQHPGLLSLREPAILRSIADVQVRLHQDGCEWTRPEFDERLSVFLKLWSRTFRPEQKSVIKATSFVGEMADELMARDDRSKSIFMFVSPPTFLKAMLDGAMSDITGMAEKRLARLHRRLGEERWRVADLSPGECVAMSWLCEMLSLHAAGRRFPDRSLWLDFDRFLDEPEANLSTVLSHFETECGRLAPRDDIPLAEREDYNSAHAAEAARHILAGPTIGQYAKAPACQYDARVRDRLLRQAEAKHADEIRKGMTWLDRAAGAFSAARAVIEESAAITQNRS